MWIGIDDAEILIEEDLLFEKERVDLRVSFLGEGATARAKDKVWDDAIISVFFFLNIYMCVCVCCDIYIYVCVKWRFFSPWKKGRLNAKHKHVSGSHFLSLPLSFSLDSFALALCPNLSSLFSLVRKKKRKKKSNQISFRKSGDFSKNPTTFCFSRYYYYVELLFSLCAYTLKRGLEKREKTSAYKSNNNNNKRERKKEQFW